MLLIRPFRPIPLHFFCITLIDKFAQWIKIVVYCTCTLKMFDGKMDLGSFSLKFYVKRIMVGCINWA